MSGVIRECPPQYDSIGWHEQMLEEGYLYQAMKEDRIIGGAILFFNDNKKVYMSEESL